MSPKKLPKSAADLANSKLKDLAVKLNGRFPKAEEVQEALGIPLHEAALLVREALQSHSRAKGGSSSATSAEVEPKAKAKTSAKKEKPTAAEKKAAKAKAKAKAAAAAADAESSESDSEAAGPGLPAEASASGEAQQSSTALAVAQPATPETSATKRAASDAGPANKRRAVPGQQLALTFPAPVPVKDKFPKEPVDVE